MIKARNLRKVYGDKVAVDRLSFEVQPGAVTGFLGPNGAGKSTTMRLMLGLDYGEGETTFDGCPFAELAEPLRTVGAVLDARSFHPHRTARNSLRLLAHAGGLDPARADDVLEEVGLQSVADKKPGGFSLGMGQRLGLASALLGHPDHLILDEPGNGLDPQGIHWLRDFLRDYAAKGRCVFVSSHLLSEMNMMADRLVVIGRGKTLHSGDVKSFIDRFSDSYVTVRSNQLATLVGILRTFGAVDRPSGDGAAIIQNLTSDQIGQIAAKHNISLFELNAQGSSLEDAFLRATGEVSDYNARKSSGARQVLPVGRTGAPPQADTVATPMASNAAPSNPAAGAPGGHPRIASNAGATPPGARSAPGQLGSFVVDQREQNPQGARQQAADPTVPLSQQMHPAQQGHTSAPNAVAPSTSPLGIDAAADAATRGTPGVPYIAQPQAAPGQAALGPGTRGPATPVSGEQGRFGHTPMEPGFGDLGAPAHPAGSPANPMPAGTQLPAGPPLVEQQSQHSITPGPETAAMWQQPLSPSDMGFMNSERGLSVSNKDLADSPIFARSDAAAAAMDPGQGKHSMNVEDSATADAVSSGEGEQTPRVPRGAPHTPAESRSARRRATRGDGAASTEAADQRRLEEAGHREATGSSKRQAPRRLRRSEYRKVTGAQTEQPPPVQPVRVFSENYAAQREAEQRAAMAAAQEEQARREYEAQLAAQRQQRRLTPDSAGQSDKSTVRWQEAETFEPRDVAGEQAHTSAAWRIDAERAEQERAAAARARHARDAEGARITEAHREVTASKEISGPVPLIAEDQPFDDGAQAPREASRRVRRSRRGGSR